MHKEFVLSLHQQSLVESHLYIVRDTLRFRIRPIESSTGLGYDDLYQEGCLWLCWAAFSYVEDSAAFATYAKKVVVNGLLSYCRETRNHNKHYLQLEISEKEILFFQPKNSEALYSRKLIYWRSSIFSSLEKIRITALPI